MNFSDFFCVCGRRQIYKSRNLSMYEDVKIPITTRTIKNAKFSNFKTLKFITIPYSVTKIEFCAFHGTSLILVEIPKSVTYIGPYAFFECISLIKVTLFNSVKIINCNIFNGCINLKTIEIIIVETWNMYVFKYFNQYYPKVDIIGIIISGVKCIQAGAYSNNTYITNIKIPDTVIKLDDYAFYNTGLISIIIPKSVVYLGVGVFCDCKELRTVVMYNSVNYLGDNIFENCPNLKTIEIIMVDKNTDYVKNYCFSGCKHTNIIITYTPEVPYYEIV